MHPAQYKRKTLDWNKWIGKKGVVVVSTMIQVAPPEQARFKPYSYVLVDFGRESHEFMGAGHATFVPGDEVECVLRKNSAGDEKGLIGYGIKVRKIQP